jgi:hypothetical protein
MSPAERAKTRCVTGIVPRRWALANLSERTVKNILRHTMVIIAIMAAASLASAQASTRVGPRIGYDFQSDEAILGASLTVPISTRIEFYPSIDLYTPDRGNKVGFNGDVKVYLPTRASYDLYAGGGLGIVNQNVAEISNTDVGVNLLFGIASRVGGINPFGEVRLLIHDDTQLVMLAGMNFRMGSP